VVTFVDTSGLYAFLASDDEAHASAVRTFQRLTADGERLLTHNYVVVECTALAQRRLGLQAVADLHDAVLPFVDVVWVDEPLHRRAVEANRAAARRAISLVDWTSFLVMRDRGIGRAWAFDRDFDEQGFTTDVDQA
jgi:predicted nucleic acid-binding protein